jgi:hypothetical protein
MIGNRPTSEKLDLRDTKNVRRGMDLHTTMHRHAYKPKNKLILLALIPMNSQISRLIRSTVQLKKELTIG